MVLREAECALLPMLFSFFSWLGKRVPVLPEKPACKTLQPLLWLIFSLPEALFSHIWDWFFFTRERFVLLKSEDNRESLTFEGGGRVEERIMSELKHSELRAHIKWGSKRCVEHTLPQFACNLTLYFKILRQHQPSHYLLKHNWRRVIGSIIS